MTGTFLRFYTGTCSLKAIAICYFRRMSSMKKAIAPGAQGEGGKNVVSVPKQKLLLIFALQGYRC